MPDEQPRASEKFRVFLDRKEVVGVLETDDLSDGTLCTLDGRPVKIIEVVYDLTSGEIDEIYLEEVRE